MNSISSPFWPVAACAQNELSSVDHGIRLLGIDYLSVQRFQDGPETHQILLGADTILIESLDLSAVPTGVYELLCLPIPLEGVEAASARVLLRSTEEQPLTTT